MTESRSRAEEFGKLIQEFNDDTNLNGKVLWAQVSTAFQTTVGGMEKDISQNAEGIKSLSDDIRHLAKTLETLGGTTTSTQQRNLRSLTSEERNAIERMRRAHRITTYQRRTGPVAKRRSNKHIAITPEEYKEIMDRRAEAAAVRDHCNHQSD